MTMNKRNILFALAATTALSLLAPTSAYALCIDPAGSAGEMYFNTSYNIMQYCDSNNWVAMGYTGGMWTKNGAHLYYNDGNIGIGTLSPVSTLAIGTVGHADYAVHVQTGSASGLYAKGTNTGSYSEGASFGVRGFATGSAGTERGGDFSSNYIGVYGEGDTYGVYGDSANVGIVGYSSGGGQGGNFTSSHIGVYGAGGNHGVYTENTGDTGVGITAYGKGASGIAGVFSSENSYALITQAGNVGIGTDTPAAALDVNGGIVIRTKQIYTTPDATTDPGNFIVFLESPIHGAAAGIKAGGILVSDTYAYATPDNNDLIVKGNVGIGTPTPSHPLHVEGTARLGNTYIATDQGGSIELGAQNLVANPVTGGTPFIDFHYGNNVGEDFNVRIVNSADGLLKLEAEDSYFTGNVGIGTASPAANLDIRGDSGIHIVGSTNPFQGNKIKAVDGVTETTNQQDDLLITSPGKLLLKTDNNSNGGGDIIFYDGADSAIMYIDEDTKNVGIGTDTPSYKLHVEGGTSIGVYGASSGNTAVRGDSTDGIGVVGISTNSTAGYFSSTSAYGLIVANGNVGIGTTTPAHPLDVNGITRIGPLGAGSNGLILQSTSGNTPFLTWDNSSSKFSMRYNSSEALAFGTGDNANFSAVMTLTKTGSLGLGTTIPGEKLTVNGNARINGLAEYAMLKLSSATTSTKDMGIYYGDTQNELRLARYDKAGAWEATPVRFDMDAPTDSLALSEAGNVGIGTITPEATLDVLTTANNQEVLAKFKVSDANDAHLEIMNSTGANSIFIPLIRGRGNRNDSGSLHLIADAPTEMSNNNALMSFGARVSDSTVTTSNLFQWSNYTTPVMTIDVDGNVGIGTDSPETTLHVSSTGSRQGITIEGNVTDGPNLRLVSSTAPHWNLDNYNGRFRIFSEPDYVTGGEEVLTISSDGNVGIGTDNPSYKLHVHSDSVVGVRAHSNTNYGLYATTSSTASPYSAVIAVGGVYGVKGSGTGYDFYAYGAGTNYGAASSIRWKNNITELEKGTLDKVLSLRAVRYLWDEEHGGKYDIGFIGEEVAKVYPEFVSFDTDSDRPDYYVTGMDYGAVTPVLVKAIQELDAKHDAKDIVIKELKDENEELRKALMTLEAEVMKIKLKVGPLD